MTAREKIDEIKRLRMLSNIMIALSIGLVSIGVLAEHDFNDSGSGFVGVAAFAAWMWGCIAYLQSKGRHWLWSLFGLLTLPGLLILMVLRTKDPKFSKSEQRRIDDYAKSDKREANSAPWGWIVAALVVGLCCMIWGAPTPMEMVVGLLVIIAFYLSKIASNTTNKKG